MKKNGFVFIESVVVLLVVALSLAILMSSYSLISRKTKEKENYNRTSDKYLLYNINSLGTSDFCNYSTKSSCGNYIKFKATADDCDTYNGVKSKMGTVLPMCKDIFNEYNIEYIYVVENIREDLNSNNKSEILNFYDNGTLEYMKTLKKCNTENLDEEGNYVDKNKNSDVCTEPIKYMIGVFRRNSEYYYASIEI